MNREYQQQHALSPVVVNQSRVVVLDTMLQQPIHPATRCRRKYQRRNSKVGKMFFESDISGSTATSESDCTTATPLPTFEAPVLADAASTISATACDTTIMPLDTQHTSVRKSLHSIIRPSKYGTTRTNAAAVSQSSYASDVKTMRRSWGHVPQLSGSSMSSVEEDDLTSCRRGGASCTTNGYCFGRSSPIDQFCYDTECQVCCESMKIHIDR